MNYYAKKDLCSACGRGEEIHIGKSSAGWKFLFHYNGHATLEAFKFWLDNLVIRNEQGGEITHADFWDMVNEKQTYKSNSSPERGVEFRSIGGYEFWDCEFS